MKERRVFESHHIACGLKVSHLPKQWCATFLHTTWVQNVCVVADHPLMQIGSFISHI